MNTKTFPELGPRFLDFGLGESLELKRIDKAKRVFDGVANAKTIDRVGDRLEPKGADLRQFRKQPLLLFEHQRMIGGQPGRIGEILEIKATDDKLPFTAQVYQDEFAVIANNVWPWIASRRISGVSVGFLPRKVETVTETLKGEPVRFLNITDWELLEISVVMIQANRESVIRQYAPGLVANAGDPEQAKHVAAICSRLEKLEAALRGVRGLDDRLDSIDDSLADLHNRALGIDPESLRVAVASVGSGEGAKEADNEGIEESELRDALDGLRDLRRADGDKG